MELPTRTLRRIGKPSRELAALACLLFSLSAFIARAADQFYLPDPNFAVQLLPPPPPSGSAEEHADFAALTWATNACTPAQRLRALVEQTNTSPFFWFESEIGTFFQSNNLPITAAFLDKVLGSADLMINAVKAKWTRLRPIPELRVVYREYETRSYPSGHATRGTVLALVLADLFPESQTAILAQGREVGWRRVLLGLHYPTDVYAGRVLGTIIVSKFKASPPFQRDFKRAMEEIAAYRQRQRRDSQRAIVH